VALPDHVLRFWAALDGLFSDVRLTPWGAVVTDGRFPRIWDANYARIDRATAGLDAAAIEDALLPALADAGVDVLHVVSLTPESTTSILTEYSSRGHRLGWDLVLDIGREPGPTHDVLVEEIPPDEALWGPVASSLALFGVEPGNAVTQLRAIESEVLVPGGKRWFGVRDDAGELVSIAALLFLEGVGYVDNVATFPHARGRGYASAVTARIVREARPRGPTMYGC
jgi:hypothetical protein